MVEYFVFYEKIAHDYAPFQIFVHKLKNSVQKILIYHFSVFISRR